MNDDKEKGDPGVTNSPSEPPGKSERPRIDWEDPSVPVGNAPALPRWPLAAFGIAWLVWVAFLVAMMLSRT